MALSKEVLAKELVAIETKVDDILYDYEKEIDLGDLLDEMLYFDQHGHFRLGRYRDDKPGWLREIEKLYLPPGLWAFYTYKYIAIGAMSKLDELQKKCDDANNEAKEEKP